MLTPTLATVKEHSSQYKTIPIALRMKDHNLEPISVLQMLKSVSKHCFLLESREAQAKSGRYSYLGYDPKLELACTDGRLTITSGTTIQLQTNRPGEEIKRILDENRSLRLDGFPTFTGGLVGYFSYDYIKYSEPTLQLQGKDDDHFKDCDLMLFDKIIAFDHLQNEVILIYNIKTDSTDENYARALFELEAMKQLITANNAPKPQPLRLKFPFRALFDEDEFCQMVDTAKDHIREGDIFQVVLSNRLEIDAEGSLFDTYRLLRKTNPSPYLFYFSSDSIEIAGASPETLAKLEGTTLHTFPLAGTRPRGKNAEEDAILEAELLADPKECAEHNMLVDLGRNDIGKISKPGSVKVEKYMQIEKFSHVMHIGSEVTGQLAEGKTQLDVIDAILPAGTLSGAPKLRACEIIDKLENNKRGLYGGAVGYLDFAGNVDTCIAIRLAFKVNGKIFVRSGAGIVADSVPAVEYQECINKAKAVMNALQTAEGGLPHDFTD